LICSHARPVLIGVEASPAPSALMRQWKSPIEACYFFIYINNKF
jgi:hypothetical protein